MGPWPHRTTCPWPLPTSPFLRSIPLLCARMSVAPSSALVVGRARPRCSCLVARASRFGDVCVVTSSGASDNASGGYKLAGDDPDLARLVRISGRLANPRSSHPSKRPRPRFSISTRRVSLGQAPSTSREAAWSSGRAPSPPCCPKLASSRLALGRSCGWALILLPARMQASMCWECMTRRRRPRELEGAHQQAASRQAAPLRRPLHPSRWGLPARWRASHGSATVVIAWPVHESSRNASSSRSGAPEVGVREGARRSWMRALLPPRALHRHPWTHLRRSKQWAPWGSNPQPTD